jgi:ketosteroid isomerase-like protein
VPAFDFPGFRAALESRDVERRLSFYAPDAVWIEYRQPTNPPHSPHIMRGREAIRAVLVDVAAAPLELTVENEVLDERRAAFTVTIAHGEGRRIIENVILEHQDGRIVHQLDVEVRD